MASGAPAITVAVFRGALAQVSPEVRSTMPRGDLELLGSLDDDLVLEIPQAQNPGNLALLLQFSFKATVSAALAPHRVDSGLTRTPVLIAAAEYLQTQARFSELPELTPEEKHERTIRTAGRSEKSVLRAASLAGKAESIGRRVAQADSELLLAWLREWSATVSGARREREIADRASEAEKFRETEAELRAMLEEAQAKIESLQAAAGEKEPEAGMPEGSAGAGPSEGALGVSE